VKFRPAQRSKIDACDRKTLKWFETNRMCTEFIWVRTESTGGFL